MKKLFSILICFCLIFNISGCKKSTVKESDVLKKYNIDEAQKTVGNYMGFLMKNNSDEMNKLYSKDLKKDAIDKEPSDVIITGYRPDETTQSGELGIISLKVTKLNEKTTYAAVETYTFNVIKESKKYKIKSLKIKNEKEVFSLQNQIRIRLKDNAKTLLVTAAEGMPKYYYEEKDKAKSNPLPISIGQYGIAAMTYEGTSQAITTTGKNPYIEVVRYEEAMMTQGGTDKGGGEEGGGGTGQGGESNMAPEKPLAKEIVAIDVIPNSNIRSMVFSLDEKYLAVQYSKNNLNNSINVYQNKTGEQISFDFEKNYPMEKVDVTMERFNDKGLIYNVTAKDNYKNDKSLSSITGKWQLDTKKFKPKRLS